MNRHCVIIGAGISGLTAAHHLARAGYKITLLESTDRVGGAIRTVHDAGFLAEAGPNTVLETSPIVTNLITEAGLDAEKIYPTAIAQNRFVVRDRRPIALPLSPVQFLTTTLFSVSSKIALIREIFVPPWDNRYEENLAQFVLRRLNRDFLDYAVNPFVAGVYAGQPDRISVIHGLPRLYALEQKYGGLIKGQIMGARERSKRNEKSKMTARMFTFRDGLQTLPDRLALTAGVRVLKKSRVTQLTHNGNQWEIVYITGETEYREVCEQVLYAGTAHGLQAIHINGGPVPDFKTMNDIRIPPVTSLSLGFRREDVTHRLNGFGVLIPEKENFDILGALFPSSIFPGRAPQGHVEMTVFIGGSRRPELADKSESEQTAMALRDLGVILGVNGTPVWTLRTYWPNAIPQYEVGYGRFKEILTNLEKRFPGLYFTGNYRGGISVGDVIVNATHVSDAMIQAIGRESAS